ncbi:transmembrane protein 136-like [Acanthaster planci]|uniref:Transmembrane protein 136-like n=1 Tax=Acanthaster planci TaxID=133434 RepID=A0A8B7XYD1_ACAPL|nr:transmembrane protein 136-like [Acanthaster planci]
MDAPSGWNAAKAVLVSFVAWTTVFTVVCCLQPRRSYGWNSRIVGAIHGVTVSTMSLSTATRLNFFAAHHAVSMAGMMTSLWMGLSGTEVSAAIGLMECTNPMLQLRWFLREEGIHKGNMWYEVNDVAFVASFLTIRGVVSQYLVHCVVAHPLPARAVKFLGIAMGLMNASLVVGLVQYALKRLMAVYKAWKRGESVSESTTASKSGSSCTTFEEITIHKEFALALEYIRHHWLSHKKI